VQRDVLVFQQHRPLVAHITRRRAGVLIVCAVVLYGESDGRHRPVATNWKLFWVITLPDFHLVNVAVAQSRLGHCGVEVQGVVVILLLALQQLFLAPDDDFEVCLPVLRNDATEILFENAKDCGKVVGLHVFRGVDSKTGETNTQQVGEIVSDAPPNSVFSGVEIGEAHQPAVVQRKPGAPVAENPVAVEVARAVRHSGEFLGRPLPSLGVVVESVAGSEVS
jgi:hypothetical protein